MPSSIVDRAVASRNDASNSISIKKSPTGSGYRLQAHQLLPVPREKVFAFFSDAFQLQTLTPSWLHFMVLTPAPIEMKPATLIDYRLRVHGIPLRWQSCISAWEPPVRFVDEQVRGPYRRWHHEHLFEESDTGTRCFDTVDYDVYGGSLVNAMFVRRDLQRIFEYRQRKLTELFAGTAATSS
jgi:ligand-binding SRPBCC domain-containing protein